MQFAFRLNAWAKSYDTGLSIKVILTYMYFIEYIP